MSGDPEQEYFADGMVEEIITALSRMRWLFVIARNSSFTYKGRAVDVKQVGRELGVRYVLEGSVRKAGNRVRITGQLIDAATGAHLWADRFDGELADIFDLQDQVTASVVGAIAPKLEQAEIERAKRKPTESLDAYDYFLRGMAAFHQFDQGGQRRGAGAVLPGDRTRSGFRLGLRHGGALLPAAQGLRLGDRSRRGDRRSRAAGAASRGLGRDDAVALCTAGHRAHRRRSAISTTAPHSSIGLSRSTRTWPGHGTSAPWRRRSSASRRPRSSMPRAPCASARRIRRCSPCRPAAAFAHFFAGRYDEASSSWAEAAVRRATEFLARLRSWPRPALRSPEGSPRRRKPWRTLRQLNPALRMSNLRDLLPFRQPQDFARWAEGLRKAGLPE